MAALAIGLTAASSCSSDDALDTQAPLPSAATEQTAAEEEDSIVTLTTTVGFGTGVTRSLSSEGVKTFVADEQIAVIYTSQNGETLKAVSNPLAEDDITAEGRQATFTVTMFKPKTDGAVRYIYPAAMAAKTIEPATATTDDATIDYAALRVQEGTVNAISAKYDLAVFDGMMTQLNLPESATLANQLAILAITMKDADGSNEITGTIAGIAVDDGTNSYSVSRPATAEPIYVAVRPTALADIKLMATGGGKFYIKSLMGKTYEAGNWYSVGWWMKESTDNNNLDDNDDYNQ